MNNVASIVAASQELKEKLGNAEYIHQCYAAHILNIAVQHGLQLASPIIKQVREFVVKIHQSIKLCDSLRTICRFENTIELKPDLDIETWWNSTYLILKKFYRMRSIMDILVAKNQNLTKIYLQEEDWLKINNIINLLESIFITTEVLSSSTYPIISDIRLTIIGLLWYLESFIEDPNNLEEYMMVDSINFKFKEYWKYVEDSTIIGTLLDLWSKTKTFIDINQCDKAVMSLQNLIAHYKNNTLLDQNTTINLQSRENKWFFFESLFTRQISKEIPAEDEINQYIAIPVNSNSNLLDWWYKFKEDFLILANIAFCYLSI